jgi:hypothetical protein
MSRSALTEYFMFCTNQGGRGRSDTSALQKLRILPKEGALLQAIGSSASIAGPIRSVLVGLITTPKRPWRASREATWLLLVVEESWIRVSKFVGQSQV